MTLFVTAILICLSVMAFTALNLLPLPVLYGLVLYLGVASLHGMQFLQRVKLLLIPSKNRPDYEYLRSIPNWRIYLYTGIQIGFVIFLSVFRVYFYLLVLFPLMVSSACACTCMYMYVCACMVCACMYMCVHVWYMHVCTCTYVCACMYMYACICMYVHVCVYMYVHVMCVHVCTCYVEVETA